MPAARLFLGSLLLLCGNTDITCVINDDVQEIQIVEVSVCAGCDNVLNKNMFGAQFSILDFCVQKNK